MFEIGIDNWVFLHHQLGLYVKCSKSASTIGFLVRMNVDFLYRQLAFLFDSRWFVRQMFESVIDYLVFSSNGCGFFWSTTRFFRSIQSELSVKCLKSVIECRVFSSNECEAYFYQQPGFSVQFKVSCLSNVRNRSSTTGFLVFMNVGFFYRQLGFSVRFKVSCLSNVRNRSSTTGFLLRMNVSFFSFQERLCVGSGRGMTRRWSWTLEDEFLVSTKTLP